MLITVDFLGFYSASYLHLKSADTSARFTPPHSTRSSEQSTEPMLLMNNFSNNYFSFKCLFCKPLCHNQLQVHQVGQKLSIVSFPHTSGHVLHNCENKHISSAASIHTCTHTCMHVRTHTHAYVREHARTQSFERVLCSLLTELPSLVLHSLVNLCYFSHYIHVLTIPLA